MNSPGHGFEKLAAEAATAACRHFTSVVLSEDWLTLPSPLVHALLSDDRLRVGSEEQVYNAAITWLKAQQPPVDAETAANVLALVRYPLVSPAFMRDVVSKEALLQTAPTERSGT